MKNGSIESACHSTQRRLLMLDIGGEGRHADAWNLNLSRVKTLGPERGAAIPRLILGRADAIPLPDGSVDRVIAERTPLRREALCEIRRIIAADGTVVLRHARPPNLDPHRLAYDILPGRVEQRTILRGSRRLQETLFRSDAPEKGRLSRTR